MEANNNQCRDFSKDLFSGILQPTRHKNWETIWAQILLYMGNSAFCLKLCVGGQNSAFCTEILRGALLGTLGLGSWPGGWYRAKFHSAVFLPMDGDTVGSAHWEKEWGGPCRGAAGIKNIEGKMRSKDFIGKGRTDYIEQREIAFFLWWGKWKQCFLERRGWLEKRRLVKRITVGPTVVLFVPYWNKWQLEILY